LLHQSYKHQHQYFFVSNPSNTRREYFATVEF
jgi:hypothetical protein